MNVGSGFAEEFASASKRYGKGFCPKIATIMPCDNAPISTNLPHFRPRSRLPVGLTTKLVLLCVVVSACGNQDVRATQPDQQALLSAKTSAEESYDSAPNDVIKHQMIEAWGTNVCSVVKSPTFTNWNGRVKTINSDGSIAVDVGDGVALEDGFVDKSSTLFTQVSALRVGAMVSISGNFVASSPCSVEFLGSQMGDDNLKNPDFAVRFTDISPS